VKKILLSFIILFALLIPAVAQNTSALYGVSPDGVYFIHKSLVEKTDGTKPSVLFSPDWSGRPMTLQGNYYVYNSGRKIIMKAMYCFAIGGNRYIPHALDGLDISGINPDDIKDNNQGGFNFITAPIKFPG